MGRKPKTTLDAPPQRAGEGRPRPQLRMVHGPMGLAPADAVYALAPGHHTVGREVDGIAVDDPRVSRTHATIHVASRSFKARIADEDSRHGTWVNGERVEEAWLTDGDLVRVGESFFVMRYVSHAEDGDVEIAALVGQSPEIRALRRAISQVAHHDVTVMIRGPSGTGKEVAARAVHDESGRRGPFMAVNCAAIPESLAESQLFGHVAGAFTGAQADHLGFVRAAQGGTLFLDEVGDMPSELQPKLLRTLETRSVIPVGATEPVPFDARILVATHRELEKLVEAGGFRGDLYARLAHFQLDLPTLQQRREDVLLLLYHALKTDQRADAELVDALLRYTWPYNVRELFAVAGELEVRGEGQELLGVELVAHRLKLGAKADDVPMPASSSTDGGDQEKVAPPTREEIERIIAEHKGNVRAISRATGRSRMQVYRWVEQYGIDLARYRE